MPTPNTEIASDMEVSTTPLNVESGDGLSDLLMMNSDGNTMDSFTTLPIDFDSSNSSIETAESVEETIGVGGNIPMLTDIAEETIYETEFFDDNSKSDSIEKCETKTIELEDTTDISNIPIEISSVSQNDECVEEINENLSSNYEEETCKSSFFVRSDCDDADDSSSKEESIFVTLTSSAACQNEAKDSKNDPALIENITIENSLSENINIVEIVPSTSTRSNTCNSNVINANSISNKKIPPFKSIAVQNTSKFVPISIAPNSMKRSASISIGQPSANVLTKVVVSQNKAGQPIVITNSPQKSRSLCLLQTPCSSQSPVKSITFAQAKQMGLIAPGKLQPIRPSTTKTVKPKVVVNSIPAVATQGLKKIQPIAKTSTPTKILPAPLVSNSSTASQSQKIFIRQDYLMKSGTIIPKQQAGQVITISNLQPSVISNHVSPKKQVQYIKLVNNVGSTNMPTVTTTKGKIATLTSNVTKIDKDTPIIVASSNFPTTNLNVKNTTTVQTSNTTGTAGITVVPMITTSVKATPGQRLLLPAVSKSKSDVPAATPSLYTETKQLKSAGNIVVLPDDVLEKIKGELLSTPSKSKEEGKADQVKQNHDNQENVTDVRSGNRSPTKHGLPTSSLEGGNGLRSRKPCNCTRSQCLKLYCECFANGEFCNNCNCVSCHNNISHEENRQHAIRSCLDRNPQAFRPKIGKCLVGLSDRRHTKGCHCKRSGCLKNYCECYEAQIPCSDNCKCVGCKNVDDMLFATSFTNSFEKNDSQLEFQNFSKNKLTAEIIDAVGQSGTSASPRHAFSFVRDQVVEATCQCLLAQAEEVKRKNINVEDGQKYILEEFGRCLIQIIECAKKSYDNISDKYLSS